MAGCSEIPISYNDTYSNMQQRQGNVTGTGANAVMETNAHKELHRHRATAVLKRKLLLDNIVFLSAMRRWKSQIGNGKKKMFPRNKQHK